MSHMSEQAGSALGGPPDGEDARGEAVITELAAQYKGHVHKRHVPSRGQQAMTAARRRVSALLLPGRT
jgi:hypothetical protein